MPHESIEERMHGLRQRAERLRDAPGAHREGVDAMLAELRHYESLPGTDSDDARDEWADEAHVRGQLAEMEAAVRWEENRLGVG